MLLSGTFDGFFGKLFFKNLIEEIKLLLKKFKKTFGNNFYIEIQRHGDQGEKIY